MMTKNDIYVVVDTPKKAKKLKRLLDMFGEKLNCVDDAAIKIGHYNGSAKLYTEYNKSYFNGINWTLMDICEDKTEVSIKELRNILAKEHLKEGDYVICSYFNNSSIVKIKSISGDRINVDKELFFSSKNLYTEGFEHISRFKRYATPEEISLLEPKQKELEVGKWYIFTGRQVEHNPLMFITSISGSIVKFRGFNFLGDWVDNDFYTLEDLKHGYTEATHEEVKSALTEEAKRRGYKKGCIIKSFVFGHTKINGSHIEYRADSNTLVIGNAWVFKDGKWAEIIKSDDKPKVGDVCKFWNYEERFYMVGKLVRIYDIKNTNYPFACSAQSWMNAKKLTQQEVIDLLFNNQCPKYKDEEFLKSF